MRIRSEQLAQHLTKQLLPIYLISGDEPLLVQQATDLIKKTAKSADHQDHQIFHVDKQFDWNLILNETESLSLFGDKKLLDIRLPNAKPGDQGAKILQNLCATSHPDNLILITSGKLDKASLNRNWAKAIDQIGAIIQIWPVSMEQFPNWLKQNLANEGLPSSPDVIEIIASKTEGNLLAASQEISKLKLLSDSQTLTLAEIRDSIADSTRYDVFTLCDECLKGKTAHSLKILSGLKEEGIEPTLILWAFTRDVRTLLELRHNPTNANNVFRKQRIFGTHQNLLRQHSPRYTPENIYQMLRICHQADLTIKGLHKSSFWELMTDLIILLTRTK
jgi:DNA polymerase-3 subunit delta